MKRLFCVKRDNRMIPVEDSQGNFKYFFEHKGEAKAVRNVLNDVVGHNAYHVSRGPDNLKSSKPNARTISGVHKYMRGNRGY